MDDPNPYVAPVAVSEDVELSRSGVGGVLADAMDLFTQNCFVIIAIVLSIWGPIEFFSSYINFFVIAEEDFASSFRLSQFLEGFIGIIATAAVISVGIKAKSTGALTYTEALATGLQLWPRMWWTSVISGLAIVGALLLLILPGIYVAIRLSIIDSVVVVEGISGGAAVRRSFELTRDRFWYIVKICLAVMALAILLSVVLFVPTAFVPVLDNWIIDACATLVLDVFAAYATLCFYCVYLELSRPQATTLNLR